MRITENRLRRIIRQVIVENLENQILDSDGVPFDPDYVHDLMGLVGITGDPEMIIKGLGSLNEKEFEDFKVDYSYVVNDNDTYFEMMDYVPSYHSKLSNLFVHKGWREID